jgi:hypothetical protein
MFSSQLFDFPGLEIAPYYLAYEIRDVETHRCMLCTNLFPCNHTFSPVFVDFWNAWLFVQFLWNFGMSGCL